MFDHISLPFKYFSETFCDLEQILQPSSWPVISYMVHFLLPSQPYLYQQLCSSHTGILCITNISSMITPGDHRILFYLLGSAEDLSLSHLLTYSHHQSNATCLYNSFLLLLFQIVPSTSLAFSVSIDFFSILLKYPCAQQVIITWEINPHPTLSALKPMTDENWY